MPPPMINETDLTNCMLDETGFDWSTRIMVVLCDLVRRLNLGNKGDT